MNISVLRFFFVSSLVASLLTMGGGCTRRTVDDPQTLVVGLSAAPTTLDPRFATDANSQRIIDLLFSSLVRNGPELKPVPELAQSWNIEDKKITFQLRSDIQFSATGKMVTADDVVFSMNEYRKPSSPFRSNLSAIVDVKAPNPRTVVFVLNKNDVPLMTNLHELKILPKEAVAHWDEDFGRHPEGSGPYVLKSLNNNEVRLAKSPFVSHVNAQTEKIDFKFIRDENTRYLKILKGEIDILLNDLPEEKVTSLKKSGRVNVLVTPGLNFNYIVLNLKNKNLSHKNFRQALFSSLDRNEIIEHKLDDLALRGESILSPVNLYSAAHLSIPTVSPDEARAVIKSLGLENHEFLLKTSDQGQAMTNGLILAQQMEKLGIKVNVQSFEWGTFYNDVKTGNFEMATMRWVGIVDPDVYRDTLATSEFPPGKNRGYYSNKVFDALVNAAREEIRPEKRKVLYQKAQEIVAEDLPTLPLWYNSNISILSRRVKNFTPMVTGSFYPLIGAQKVASDPQDE